MESLSQNPDFRNNLENFHPCHCQATKAKVSLGRFTRAVTAQCSNTRNVDVDVD